jgi:hypothetical protein
VHPEKYAMRLEAINRKLSNEEKEPAKVMEMHLTEQSIRDNLHKVVGSSCPIFAKLLYMKCSENHDFSKCGIITFFRVLSTLIVSLPVF